MSQATLVSAVRPPEFGWRYANYALGLLLVVGVFNIVDRSIIGLLLQPIARDLRLTDSQLGLFSGPAFGFFYALSQVPLASLADRVRRGRMIAGVLAFWSVATALQGFASGFLTLLAARAAVGFGEAGNAPAAHSMISDLFPPARRATALAVLATLLPLGGAVGALVAGWGREALGWRGTLQLVGLPGIALALLVWMLREPTRGYWDGVRIAERAPSLRETLGLLLRLPAFRFLLVAQSLSAFTFVCQMFDAVFMERSLGLAPREIGRLLAAASALAIPAALAGGWIADRMARRGADWSLRCAAMYSTSYALTSSAVYFAATPATIAPLYLFGACMPNTLGVVFAVTQSLAPPAMRARASALVFATSTFVGGLGPLLIGALSDALTPSLGSDSARRALLLVVPAGWLACALHFGLASRTFSRDLQAKDEHAARAKQRNP
jgi:MFS family permease